MDNKRLIELMLGNLAKPNPRLRCPITRLHIQIEMQYPSVQSLITYFTMIQPEYKYHWNQYPTTNAIRGFNLTNFSEYTALKNYMTGQKLITHDEAEWLEDAIHETLVYDD